MTVTLKDIAERAGVTSATVSMVINNKPNISENTRKKVLKIAKELNYYPNVIARGLATRKSNSIGVIVPNLASSFVVRILQGIKSTNRDIEYTVQLFDTIGQKENESQLFQRLARERRIDGVILISSTVTDEDLNVFRDESVPSIVVARKCESLDSVYVNNERGAMDAIDYLVEKGHRQIACVTSSKQGLPTAERLSGYKLSLQKHGIEFNSELVFELEDDSMAAGLQVFQRILEVHPKVTAVFVPAGDMVAVGIVKEAKRKGVVVPTDLAVVGYDDLPAAEVLEPALTTVRQPKLEMGDYAINMIVDKIEGREAGVKHKELQTKFIIRESA
ncbi:LacI family DNA-binding transcriptional regulator [Chitinispirillales bacterium ANBcel5]|uniref:LacI family DNA-binding transcriptional regulator n=1 Tax=Cellulosispirillum alkaliphilum TaxID=3039283 RepID=UPI002A504D4F|nr:LacI family DNA-binding transcriptional regulator [Chitinispirillales bacterium ANBcel5]